MSMGGPKPSAFYLERQALTRSPATPTAPSGATSNTALGQIDPGEGTTRAGDGLVLAGLMGVVVSVYANSNQTLSGSGSLLCWIFNPYQQAWTRCPDLDFDLTYSSTFAARTFPTLQNVSRLGMLINWLTSGVGVSSGADVLLRLDGFQSVLGM